MEPIRDLKQARLAAVEAGDLGQLDAIKKTAYALWMRAETSELADESKSLLAQIRLDMYAVARDRKAKSMRPWEVERENRLLSPKANERPRSAPAVRGTAINAAASSALGVHVESPNPAMVCPHCQAHGYIATNPGNRKQGVSGGKATAAVLTGGLSLLLTGLSRKEGVTEAHCHNCGNRWTF